MHCCCAPCRKAKPLRGYKYDPDEKYKEAYEALGFAIEQFRDAGDEETSEQLAYLMTHIPSDSPLTVTSNVYSKSYAWTRQDNIDRAPPKPSDDTFPGPDSVEWVGKNCTKPSAKFFANCYIREYALVCIHRCIHAYMDTGRFLRHEEFIRIFRQLVIGKMLKSDHHWKLLKKVVVAGKRAFDCVFAIMNEYNEVYIQHTMNAALRCTALRTACHMSNLCVGCW